jgi:hypothetical protein
MEEPLLFGSPEPEPLIHIYRKPSTITPFFWLKHADMRANTPDMSGHWTTREGTEDRKGKGKRGE